VELRPIHQTRCKLPLWVDITLRKATKAKAEKRYQALSEFMTDLQQANQAHLNAVKNTPWLERDPLLF
jgi:protein phosphatase